MSIRILGGDMAGRIIKTPDTTEVRPPGSRLKRTVFDLLGDAVVGARVCDLYAGVGSFSFEALSRGAAEATLVEKNAALVDYIYNNAKRLGFSEEVRVYEDDVQRYLADVKPERPYDIIFIDPPYRSGHIAAVLELINRWPGVSPGSLVITRVFKKEVICSVPGFGTFLERTAGDDKISFFRVGDGTQERKRES